MAALIGGRVRTPRGVLPWQPARPVATAYARYTANAADGYVCAGVIGNAAHLNRQPPEDHTPYSSDDITIAGHRYVPKTGWVYAIDGHVPDPARFEKWLVARLRAGYYKSLKYFNINNHHWTRVNGFARATHSGDEHLHMSTMPGSEYSPDDILGDYEYLRTHGSNVTAARKPVAAPARPYPVEVAAKKLPVVQKGSKGSAVRIAQAIMVAQKQLPWGKIDGDFGDRTAAAIRAAKGKIGLPTTGIVDLVTWARITPDLPPAVVRGTTGYYASLMQALLIAHGANPGAVDGQFGDNSVAALKRFQVTRKVRNSVVAGRGDGIGGTATWVSLLSV